ncbi:MAG: uroporphyrinogen-III C-methyltransferase [Elusimicrobiota bacterium]
MSGKVFLVGAGPGRPDLITLAGVRCIQKADVVVYDHLADPMILSYAPANSERIYVGKQCGRHTLAQQKINELLVKKAKNGHTVVRLKGGDPFVFGRGGEECEALYRAGVDFEVIPGVTAGVAGPAFAGIPVTHRKMASSVAFITGHEDPSKSDPSVSWEHLAKGADTLVFYMGASNLASIAKKLINNGRPAETPVAVIQWGATPRQRTVTGRLNNIVEAVSRERLTPPAIIVAGNVVKLRKHLAWFEKKPLFGKKIINTRSRHQASELSDQLVALGAEVLELPAIEIRPVGKNSGLRKEIDKIKQYDWIIFTSANGVMSFFKLFMCLIKDVRKLGHIRIGSIGPGTTSEIAKYGIRADVTAKQAVAEGLIKELESVDKWKNKKVLIPRAEKGRDVLPAALKKLGAKVNVVKAYTTVMPSHTALNVLNDILNDKYDLISFSSSSTFENFIRLMGKRNFRRIGKNLKAASIGPITSSLIRKAGIEPKVEAGEHTIAGLVQAIKSYFSN